MDNGFIARLRLRTELICKVLCICSIHRPLISDLKWTWSTSWFPGLTQFVRFAQGRSRRFLYQLWIDFSKAQYSAEFLCITSICFAKLSFVVFLRNLTPLAFDRKFGSIIGLVVIMWALTAILTIAFQCSLPQPWDYVNQSCFNRVSVLPSLWLERSLNFMWQTAWANYVAVMNILTDVGLIALPLVIVARLSTANNKKVMLVLFFMTRVW